MEKNNKKKICNPNFIIPVSLIFFLFHSSVVASVPSDADISNAVSDELTLHASIPAYMVDVSTSNGIVTLSGTVSNLLAAQRAEKVAMAVRGVRGVIDEIKVNTPFRSNDALQNDVEDALVQDPATASYAISVTADDGIVTLNGRVASWQEKQLAGYAVESVKGVMKLVNDLQVNYNIKRPDIDIEEDIIGVLNNDIRVNDGLIDVSVHNGNVILAGIVGSLTEKYQARADAWVGGVVSVNADSLDVEAWALDERLRQNKFAVRSDSAIKKAVQNTFLYDPRLNAYNPAVEVSNGIVTLTGQVNTVKAKNSAEEDAKNVVGVFAVKNYLKVRPDVIPSDINLEETLENAFSRDSYLGGLNIAVNADNGVVYLSGYVNNYFEKAQAENIADQTTGVIAVRNDIQLFNGNQPTGYIYNNYDWNTFYPFYYEGIYRQPKTDWEIKESIQDQLWWSPFVNENQINITVDNGRAVLTGAVDTEKEKYYAGIAAFKGGAQSVENDLKVKYYPKD